MAGESIISGNARFSFGGKTVFHATNCNISMTRAFKERTTKDTDGTQRGKGSFSWGGGGDALLVYGSDNLTTMDFYALVAAHQDDSDTPLTIEVVQDEIDATKKLSGECFLESLEATMAVNEDGTLSFGIVGNGKFTIEDLPAV